MVKIEGRISEKSSAVKLWERKRNGIRKLGGTVTKLEDSGRCNIAAVSEKFKTICLRRGHEKLLNSP